MRFLTQKTGLGVRWEDLPPHSQEEFRARIAETYTEEAIEAAVVAAYKELYGPHPIGDGAHRVTSFLEEMRNMRPRNGPVTRLTSRVVQE
jgi:hypothetical protein